MVAQSSNIGTGTCKLAFLWDASRQNVKKIGFEFAVQWVQTLHAGDFTVFA